MGMPSVGETYTLTCTVSIEPRLPGTPNVQWLGPGVSMEKVTVGNIVNEGEMIFTKKLTFSPLTHSENYVGNYTCRATTLGRDKEKFQIVHVTRKSLEFLLKFYFSHDCIASTRKCSLHFILQFQVQL